MKKFMFIAALALGLSAHADQQQQPPQQPQPVPPAQVSEEVTFSQIFHVFECTQDATTTEYTCEQAQLAFTNQVVTVVQDKDDSEKMIGNVTFEKEVGGKEFMFDVEVVKHTVDAETHYGLHITSMAAKSQAQTGVHTDYASVHTADLANLNQLEFYSFTTVGDKLYAPYLALGPATAQPVKKLVKIKK